MSIQSSTINLTAGELPDTYYFHRNYFMDLPFDDSYKVAKRIATVSLPLLSLYKPLHTPLALTLGAMRVFNLGNQFVEEESLIGGTHAAVATCAFAATFFNRTIGALITSGQDILASLHLLYTRFDVISYINFLTITLGIANDALYLALLLSGGAQLAVASLAMQVITHLVYSIRYYQRDDQIGAVGNLAIALARGQQARAFTQ